MRPGGPVGSFRGGPAIRPEAGAGSFPGSSGSRPESGPSRRPSEPPDPRAPMVTVQAVLVELVQDEAATTGRGKEATAPGSGRDKDRAEWPRKAESPSPEGKSDPVARVKGELGLINLDLGASPATILAELRKLGVRGRLDVLNRLQLTTLDKQSASVQLGRMEPVITGTSRTQFGTTNNVTLQNFGLLMAIVPRVVPNGVVTLEIDLNQSRQGRAEEGVALSTSSGGDTIRHPPTIRTMIQSIVKAPAGKTVVVTAATSESGPRRTETLLLVSAHVLKVQGD